MLPQKHRPPNRGRVPSRGVVLLVCLPGIPSGVMPPIGVTPVAKSKTPPARPAVPPRSRVPGLNPRLDVERRRLLQKHYRARHGVK
jgi:hypothetical protein